MKIIFSGAVVVDGRGKLGGTVASKNRGGAFMRNRVNPSNPQTSAQTQVRATFSFFSSAWRGLTDGQRTAWQAATPGFPYQDSLGQSKIYTGQQLFMKLNQTLQQANPTSAQLSAPPLPVSAPAFLFNTIEYEVDAGALQLARAGFSAATIPAGFVLNLFVSPGVSPGIMSTPISLKQVLPGQTVVAGFAQLTNRYVGAYGVPAIGTKVFTRASLVSLDSGQQFSLGALPAIVVEA